MNGKVKVVLLIIAVLAISGIVSFVSVVAISGRGDKIFPGVTIKEIPVGNMTKEEAGQALTEYAKALGQKNADVRFDGGNGSFLLSDVGLQLNIAAAIDKAWQVGRNGNFFQQWQERKDVARNGVFIPIDIEISKDKLRGVLDNLTKAVRVPPRDARIVITPRETVEMVDSANGKGIDLDSAFTDLQTDLKDDLPLELDLKLVQLKPALTTADIENLKVNGPIASFTTRFDPTKTNRVYNIRVAAEALDGQMIKPGEAFSFNKVVGPRSQEAGYKMAPTILNNEFVDSLGGGVCQVSTTLYNTLLQGDVEILQRSNHSLVVRYVPLGQDAAVAYGGKDLVFKNNLPCALVLKTSVSGNTITVRMFGDTSLAKSVKIVNNIVKEYPFKIVYKNDPTRPNGSQKVEQKGVKGYRVSSYMMIYQGGKFLGKRTLKSSYYAPLDEVVLVGTKPVTTKPVNSKPVTGKPDDAGEPEDRNTYQPDETNPGGNGTETPQQPPVTPPAENTTTQPTNPGDTQPSDGQQPDTQPPATEIPPQTQPDQAAPGL